MSKNSKGVCVNWIYYENIDDYDVSSNASLLFPLLKNI